MQREKFIVEVESDGGWFVGITHPASERRAVWAALRAHKMNRGNKVVRVVKSLTGHPIHTIEAY